MWALGVAGEEYVAWAGGEDSSGWGALGYYAYAYVGVDEVV